MFAIPTIAQKVELPYLMSTKLTVHTLNIPGYKVELLHSPIGACLLLCQFPKR